MVDAAMAALDTLNKKDLGNCKTMAKPPAGVGDIFGAVVVLFAGINPNVIVQKNGKVKDKDRSWEATKKALLGNINALVEELKGFKTLVDDQQVPEVNWKEIRPFLALEHFNVEIIEKKNSAAAGLCAWVMNIVAYYDAIIVVEPKKRALEEANEKLRVANERLEMVNQKVTALEEKLATLTGEFDKVNQEVLDAVALLERGRLRMELARRLAKALGSESERWSHELEQLRVSAEMLVCDVVIAASFVSYVGAFTKPFRDVLINEKWLPFLRKSLAETSSKGDKDKPAPVSSAISGDGNPLQILATESEIAEWNTKGLPSDRVSVENGAIVRNSARAPLLIDPQLQGIYWLREMEKHARRASPGSLQVVRQDQPNLPNLLETAVEYGHSVVVENMGEKVEVCLWPVISRSTTVRGHKTQLKMGDKLVELHSEFRLYLHTKLSNPHYPPELQAETTMINFAVTQQGLEDQLLALVVRKEWPKVAKVRTALIHQQNEFKIRIQTLEDRILSSLADAEGDVTENVQVITDLETTKATAQEIAIKAAKAKENEVQINELSAKYQSVASRGALLFFIMDGLHRMHSYYVYSLNAYVVIFQRGIDLVQSEKDPARPPSSGGGGGLLGRLKAAAKKVIVSQRFQWNADLLLADRVVENNSEQDLDALMKETDQQEMPSASQIETRCTQLKASITDVVFNYIRRGLFEKDKLTLATQLCFAILQSEKKIDAVDVRQLVACASAADTGSGMGLLSEWMSETTWLRVRKLEENISSLQKLTTFMRSDSEEWREWCDSENPELKPLPGQYKTSITPMQLLHLIRVLRPDRMIFALRSFLGETFGKQMVQQPPFDMEAAYQETSASTPMFFVLFPGVDPTSWVEGLGKKFDFTYERGNLINISMGQGQEGTADNVLMKFSREGNWVILQNIHLMQSWLPRLERTLEIYSVSADQNFRCFLSSEGPALASISNLPESLLQSCIKVANEAPTDLKSNLRRAWANFSAKQIEVCVQPNEFQGCLFALCFFHALVLGRRRFGSQGWSRPYSFNTGDLLICSDVLRRYMDTAATSRSRSLPWDDLRYIFGEIMYGGHITDHWDRITNNTYLNEVFTREILQGKELTVGFKCPDPSTYSYSKYLDHIETQLPSESPTVYGLHPNAEVGYLVEASNELFGTIAKFQPSAGPAVPTDSTASSSTSSGFAKENAQVYSIIEGLLEKLPPEIDLPDLQTKAVPLLATDQSPYVVLALQEATRMHTLLHEIQSSLIELTKGIQGTLNMTDAMEDLMEALSTNQVPGRNVLHMCSWERYAWWSRKSLSQWFADLLDRIQFLSSWTSEFRLPYSMWISGLFNPTAFLTAIKQCTARTHGIPLDSMAIETHVTPIGDSEGAEAHPEMGAYIHGLFMEGARWELPLKDGEKTSPFSYEIDGIPCGGHLVDPMPKELLPAAPVIYARAVVIDSRGNERVESGSHVTCAPHSPICVLRGKSSSQFQSSLMSPNTSMSQDGSPRSQMRHSRSMDMGVARKINFDSQKVEVKALINAKKVFSDTAVETEVEWFYGPLGVHDFYFCGQSPAVIAQHIQSLLAAKLMSKAKEVKLEQEGENGAFFAVLSNVKGSYDEPTRRAARYDAGITETEVLERRLERQYLSGSSGIIGDGVKAGYQHLEKAESHKKRTYRMQCYRTSGVLDPVTVPYHVRMYFLQEPQFVDPTVSENETDINKVADKVFLERAGDRLKGVYQECITKAMSQTTPTFHTEVWSESDGSKMARVAIAYRSGATHSYFSSIADVYRQHGLFSQRKYTEFFANGIVIYTFYLQMLDTPTHGTGDFETRLAAVIKDASMHFTLPRTSLTPMLTDGLLNPQQIAYAYAAWKFTFHFMHRLPESFALVSKSLRDRDPSAFARLEQLRSSMKLNTFTESQILDHILSSADIVKVLYNEFVALHAPGKKAEVDTNTTMSTLRKSIVAEQALQIFSMFHVFNLHIKKTNFFANDKAALAFRLDGSFLSKTEFPDEPYAVVYVIGSEFRGFHVRFLDVARGGIRMIRSSHAQVYLNNASSLFDECYGLASTQHRKNKDIPEGGSKGVVLLNQAHQDKADVAFRKYIDAMLDIMLMKEGGEDILFLGPDEGTAHLMDWASSHAKNRGYSYWKAITTGKSATRGGIPHDVYGMTTHSVREYVVGIQRKLQLQAPITKVQTGGPDGDLGSNEIKMSPQEQTVAVVDGSGVLYDPKGIDRESLVALAESRSPISGFDMSKLSPEGYAVLVSQNDVTLPSGEVVENGTQFRNFYHLRPNVTADFFVPCGGRPAAVNLNNVEQFMYREDGRTLRFKYIVEGANLFFTQDARQRLEDAGVILFKDASANKGGVTSSSLEVLAALAMTDADFTEHMQVDEATGKIPDFYAAYVSEVQKRIDLNAQREFECIWREHERTGTYFSELTNQLSERITDLSAKVQHSGLWENKALREKIFTDGFPEILLSKTTKEELLSRLPESYTRALFASQLASRFIYSVGLGAPEFSFYEFIEELIGSN
ncbi:hypothetical protein BBP00_00002023 [Phytophthora kernoviae]|uniref:Glutamate/phenylalanine/leucine/valine/L-tryptophan dehydrogenase C-terminal domain-containing protein n=1 Tax=Phytophthora kernoviae TaxID=325452 RepID=A0A3F2RYI7_9STRA|nr:hypothetical protein BBP00_00002023 [Phytophthora kernoviae]